MKTRNFLTVLFTFSLLPISAQAFVVYDSFGSFPDATWGGTGIPNADVAAAMTIVDGSDTIRVAMSATQRYTNPALTNNGAAVYTAGTGSSFEGPNNTEGALWNWNFFIDVKDTNGGTTSALLTDYQIDIYYDLDPAGPHAFGDLSGLGKIDLTGALAATDPSATLAEDSQNNMFGYLATGNPFVTPPGGTFDPNAVGNYQFAMVVSKNGFFVETIAMEVNAVPVPAALWLFGSALAGLAGLRLKKK